MACALVGHGETPEDALKNYLVGNKAMSRGDTWDALIDTWTALAGGAAPGHDRGVDFSEGDTVRIEDSQKNEVI
jgi:hypothetical protein